MPDTKPPINLDDMDFGHTIRGLQKDDRVFERFVLKRLLGRGGMGVVWLATDQRLGRDVALKFAPEVVRWDDLAVEELKEETRKGLELAHPNIVKIYDFLLDEEHAAISMEFIDGENLGVLRTRQPNKVFEPRQISSWMVQLLDALDYAHRGAKVIHRDLKPANLMIDREGNLRVTDFGIARSISDALDRATMGGASTGTLAYMSPQQAAGRKPHISDDLYSFGSTAYELLTGKPPFFTGNIAQQLSDEPVMSVTERRHEFGVVAEPVEPIWEQTILTCLAKRPEERPASAMEIRDRLGLGPISRPHGGVTTTLVSSPTPPPIGGATGFTGGVTYPSTHGHATSQPRVTQGLQEIPTSGATVTPVSHKTQPYTQPQQPQVQPRKSSFGLIVVGLIFFGMVALVAGGWWGYGHYQADVDKFILGKLGLQPAGPGKVIPKQPDGKDEKKIASNDPNNNNATGTADVQPLKEGGKDSGPIPNTGDTHPQKNKTDGLSTESQDPKLADKFTSIQEAIKRAKSGDTITVPSGTYDEQLRLKDGVSLLAEESGKVVVRTDGKTGSALIIENCHAGSIKGLVFQHTGTDVVEKASWPVVMMRSSSIVFENNTVQAGVGDGMSLTGTSKPDIRRCVFSNNSKNGLVIEAGALASVTACECRKNGESGIEIRLTGSSATLTGNTLADNAGSGVVVKDGASANIVQNNKLLGNGQAGIAAVGEGVSILVNAAECDGNQIGIFVKEGAKAAIAESTVRNSKEVGIHFDGPAEGTDLNGNTIEKSTMAGVEIIGSSGLTVTLTGNKAKLNGTNGIAVFGAGFKPRIERNEAQKNGQYGILVAEGCGGVLRENTAQDNNLAGIGQVQAATDLSLQSNVTDQGTSK